MLQEVNQAIRHTKRYWYEDGLVEIAAGCLFLFGVASLLVTSTIIFPAVAGSPIAAILAAGLIFVISMVVMNTATRINSTIQTVKDRITYPRTGYVEYATPEAPRRSPIVGILIVSFMSCITAVILVIVLSIVLRVIQLSDWLLSMPMTEGFMTCVLLGVLGYRLRIIRFYAVGVLALLAGVVAASQNAGDIVGTEIYFLLIAFVLIGSGLGTLLHYLRRASPTGNS